VAHHRHIQPRAVALDPGLALARAERDHQQVAFDALMRRIVSSLLISRPCRTRRLVADADQPLRVAPEPPPRGFGDAVGAAEEIDREPRLVAAAAQRLEQVRAGDALAQRDAGQCARATPAACRRRRSGRCCRTASRNARSERLSITKFTFGGRHEAGQARRRRRADAPLGAGEIYGVDRQPEQAMHVPLKVRIVRSFSTHCGPVSTIQAVFAMM